uniref:Uncharacterized protein n=1 Tax=Pseudomonas phage Touem01 TaxID=3138548 RepID=A0AAU6W291_9VIRU
MEKFANRDAVIALGHLEEFCKRGLAVDPIGPVRTVRSFIQDASAEITSLRTQLADLKGTVVEACDRIIEDRSELTLASRDVLAERQRQVQEEKRDHVHDDQYTVGELSDAAGTYALHAHDDAASMDGTPSSWPWEAKWFKLGTPRRNLVKAAALILAEIERLDRVEAAKPANWDRTKPEWSSHDWPQIFQTSDGNWYGVRAGWDLKAHISGGWKGDEVSLLSDDGKFIKYGEPSPDWRDSLEQRPVAELYTADDEARMDVVGQNGPTGEHYGVLPLGLSWDTAPSWAEALVEADATNTDIKERSLVWVSELNKSTTGVLAIDFFTRKAGDPQAVDFPDYHSWTVVATRPVAVDDGWIEWNGGLCPVADLDAMIWVRLEGDTPTTFGRPGYASRWDWRHTPEMGRSRVVAYRLTDPAVQP